MKIKKVMEEVVEARAIHAFDIGVLIAPGEGLLTDDGVHRVELGHIGVIHKLAVLNIYIDI